MSMSGGDGRRHTVYFHKRRDSQEGHADEKKLKEVVQAQTTATTKTSSDDKVTSISNTSPVKVAIAGFANFADKASTAIIQLRVGMSSPRFKNKDTKELTAEIESKKAKVAYVSPVDSVAIIEKSRSEALAALDHKDPKTGEIIRGQIGAISRILNGLPWESKWNGKTHHAADPHKKQRWIDQFFSLITSKFERLEYWANHHYEVTADDTPGDYGAQVIKRRDMTVALHGKEYASDIAFNQITDSSIQKILNKLVDEFIDEAISQVLVFNEQKQEQEVNRAIIEMLDMSDLVAAHRNNKAMREYIVLSMVASYVGQIIIAQFGPIITQLLAEQYTSPVQRKNLSWLVFILQGVCNDVVAQRSIVINEDMQFASINESPVYTDYFMSKVLGREVRSSAISFPEYYSLSQQDSGKLDERIKQIVALSTEHEESKPATKKYTSKPDFVDFLESFIPIPEITQELLLDVIQTTDFAGQWNRIQSIIKTVPEQKRMEKVVEVHTCLASIMGKISTEIEIENFKLLNDELVKLLPQPDPRPDVETKVAAMCGSPKSADQKQDEKKTEAEARSMAAMHRVIEAFDTVEILSAYPREKMLPRGGISYFKRYTKVLSVAAIRDLPQTVNKSKDLFVLIFFAENEAMGTQKKIEFSKGLDIAIMQVKSEPEFRNIYPKYADRAVRDKHIDATAFDRACDILQCIDAKYKSVEDLVENREAILAARKIAYALLKFSLRKRDPRSYQYDFDIYVKQGEVLSDAKMEAKKLKDKSLYHLLESIHLQMDPQYKHEQIHSPR